MVFATSSPQIWVKLVPATHVYTYMQSLGRRVGLWDSIKGPIEKPAWLAWLSGHQMQLSGADGGTVSFLLNSISCGLGRTEVS